MGEAVSHATAVSINGKAVLICGPSGSGKSALALELMARGGELIADDGVRLEAKGGQLWAQCPESLRGQIEVRFVGILAAEPASAAPIALVVDMGEVETERLPPHRTRTLDGVELPCLHKVEGGYFAAAILLYLKGTRLA